VAAALDASAFPWGIVPRQIEIRIGKGYDSEAWRGTISLPAAGQAASDEWAKSGKKPERHPKPNTKRRSKGP